MPEITSLKFDLLEVAKTLLREQGITEGFWQVGIQYHLNVGNMLHAANGQKLPPGVPCPTIAVSILGLNLVKVDQPGEMTIDAAELIEFPSEIL
jgi:hypothetical protein